MGFNDEKCLFHRCLSIRLDEGFRLDLLYNNPETSLLVPFFPLSGWTIDK